MPSPIVPAQICEAIPSASSDMCSKLTKFFNLAQLLCDFFSWALTSNGSLSQEFLGEITANTLPPGTLVSSASPNMGVAWLLCNGAPVSRSQYANLFLAIGTRYGPGDGATTFNLPDVRGRSLMGVGQGPGLTNRDIATINVGAEGTTMQANNLIAHTHPITSYGGGDYTGGDGGDILNHPEDGPLRMHDTGSTGQATPTPMDIVHPCFLAYVFIKV